MTHFQICPSRLGQQACLRPKIGVKACSTRGNKKSGSPRHGPNTSVASAFPYWLRHPRYSVIAGCRSA